MTYYIFTAPTLPVHEVWAMQEFTINPNRVLKIKSSDYSYILKIYADYSQ